MADTVAIVHDYLNQPGGAERVVLYMARAIWPDAPIYTSLYRPESTFPEFRDCDVRTSFLDRFPVDAGFRWLLPLYPAAFRSLGPLDEDLVISSSSAWAHGVRTAPGSRHVVYCHRPAHWLYAGNDYFGSALTARLVSPMLPALRRWDRGAARRADRYIANSHFVSRRVRDAYGIDAPVVYPPVDTARFTARPRGERLLVVSRLLPNKRVDLVVRAATQLGIGLDVVGTGPALAGLHALAGPTVAFHGQLSDHEVTDLFESCSAFCFPGEEDFGIAPIEANAAGKPVVAFASGGALETLEPGRSAVFFTTQTVDAVVDAIRRVESLDTSPEELARGALRFSGDAFKESLLQAIGAG